MIVTQVIRGNIVEFQVTFLDAIGGEIDPLSAIVTVNYLSGGERVNETIDLTLDSSAIWTGEWSSEAADAGRVFWSARSTSPVSAQDGFFDLRANLANQNIGASS